MSKDPSRKLVMRFLADLLDRTMDITDDDAHQRAVQAFVDELLPWFPPDAPPQMESRLFDRLNLDERTEIVSVDLSPAGWICFRAWCHRRGLNFRMSFS